MYKTYSFVYEKKRIKEFLENRGFTVKTLSTVIDTIPSLKDIKYSIFRAEEKSSPSTSGYKPSILYRVRLAWKTDLEFKEIQLAIEKLVVDWNKDSYYRRRYNMPIHYLMWHFGEGNMYIMENVFGRMLKEQINKL